VIQAINLRKCYGDLVALDNLNLEIGPGQICCLLGANGAGKTTTINLFLDFIPRSSGRALIADLDVAEHPLATKAQLAYIPEVVSLYPTLTGFENLRFFSRLSGLTLSRAEMLSLAARVGLASRAMSDSLRGYSKGMRQKLGLAIALARRAKVLLMDEPLSGLDPKAANEFTTLLREVAHEGVAVLMTTHDIFRAREVATQIGIMRAGHLIEYLDASAIDATSLESVYLAHMKSNA
jgi:ABC-2 type transport system ATP-binding protein